MGGLEIWRFRNILEKKRIGERGLAKVLEKVVLGKAQAIPGNPRQSQAIAGNARQYGVYLSSRVKHIGGDGVSERLSELLLLNKRQFRVTSNMRNKGMSYNIDTSGFARVFKHELLNDLSRARRGNLEKDRVILGYFDE